MLTVRFESAAFPTRHGCLTNTDDVGQGRLRDAEHFQPNAADRVHTDPYMPLRISLQAKNTHAYRDWIGSEICAIDVIASKRAVPKERPQRKPSDIRKLRDQLGMTQAEFGQEVGVEQATVSRWEKGIQPSGANLTLLVHFLLSREIPVDSLSMFADMTSKEASRYYEEMVPLIGFADRNLKITLIGEDPHDRRVNRCHWATVRTAAIQVNYNLYAQSTNYYFENNRKSPNEKNVGRLSIFELINGEILIGRLLPCEKKGHFLIAPEGGAPFGPEQVKWICPITWVFHGFEP